MILFLLLPMITFIMYLDSSRFAGKNGEVVTLIAPAVADVSHIVLVGCGKKEEFSIVTVGRLQDNHDPRFFSFTELPNPINADSYSIQNGQMQDIVIDGLKISLDDNWKTEDNRVYRISNKTPQDSIFFIETFNYKQSGFTSVKQLAKILLISNQGVMLLTDGSDIFYKDGNYNIVMRMLDQYQNKVTIQQTQIIERDEEHISLATLACYETLYLDNKQFFDSIIY